MRDLTREMFEDVVHDKAMVGLVVFHAAWCAPSRSQLAFLDSLRQVFAGKPVFIGQVDVDALPDLADAYEVRTLPTCLLIGGGELIEILPGYQTEEFVKDYLAHLLKSLPTASSSSPS